MKSHSSIEINLDTVREGLRLWIDSRKNETLFDAEDSAKENNEARFQLVEGCFYDYQINNPDYILGTIDDDIIQQHKRTPHIGSIAPNVYVGTLEIPLVENSCGEKKTSIQLEVQSAKTGYREDYRDMLEFISEKCTDLLLQTGSPVYQHLAIEYAKDSQTLYQRFSFIKSVIQTDDFAEAIHRIVSYPVTGWQEISESKDIRCSKRFSNTDIKQILKEGNRTKLPETHYLKSYGIESLPVRTIVSSKIDSEDVPENRFIKHVLEVFLKFCTDINDKARDFKHQKMQNESETLIRELESHLNHAFFRNTSKPTTLKLNSPVLQRKEGYREVLRVWLMFDLAARLIWSGGEDVYGAGKKDIAALYEYWLFFKLMDLFQNIFKINQRDISDLIQATADGLNLRIKQGKFVALRGVYDSGGRRLRIRFNYNRTFSGRKKYPDSGSWTTTFRPDYTLSIWPYGISANEAEKQELIVHVHFDAKYKVANFLEMKESEDEEALNEEKKDNRKGIYKNADLLKMHAYKDAIRRTGGAYVLYPGDKSMNQKGFHEIIPGLGAFSIKPSKKDSGIGEIKSFILEILTHFINRASQRERIAFRTYDIFKDPPGYDSEVKELLPETYGPNRDLIPDETYVLVGFYNSPEQYEWIKEKKLYNFRTGTGTGSLILDKETISSKYLLLHTTGDTFSGNLWKIVGKGARVFSKEDLIEKGYPQPQEENYLVVSLEPVNDPEFVNVKWDFRRFPNYASGRLSARPFTVSLTEMMKNKVK